MSERRRRSEPVPQDRRARKRRGPSPSSWRWPGFVIVDTLGQASASREAARKRVLVVDLIITDLLMPRKDDVETIRGLCRQHPDARVIAVTGARGRFNRLTAARHVGTDRALLKRGAHRAAQWRRRA